MFKPIHIFVNGRKNLEGRWEIKIVIYRKGKNFNVRVEGNFQFSMFCECFTKSHTTFKF